jgi:hypothetical protein
LDLIFFILDLGFYFWSGGGGFWKGRRILEGAEDFGRGGGFSKRSGYMEGDRFGCEKKNKKERNK